MPTNTILAALRRRAGESFSTSSSVNAAASDPNVRLGARSRQECSEYFSRKLDVVDESGAARELKEVPEPAVRYRVRHQIQHSLDGLRMSFQLGDLGDAVSEGGRARNMCLRGDPRVQSAG